MRPRRHALVPRVSAASARGEGPAPSLPRRLGDAAMSGTDVRGVDTRPGDVSDAVDASEVATEGAVAKPLPSAEAARTRSALVMTSHGLGAAASSHECLRATTGRWACPREDFTSGGRPKRGATPGALPGRAPR